MIENLGLYAPGDPSAEVSGIEMLAQSSCDGGGGGDGGGDGTDGDGDGSDGGYS